MTDTSGARPVVLALLDGWGVRAERANNAIALARTPIFDRLAATGPTTVLRASGEAVGLGPGRPGHAQAGHGTIAAGRAALDGPNLIDRIDEAMDTDGPFSIAENPALKELVQRLRGVGGAVHLIGLMSPAGIHGDQHHMAVLAALLSHEGFQVWVHAIMDGEDTPPHSGLDHLAEFLNDISGASNAGLATVTGRAVAMNRLGDWHAVEQAYRAIAEAEGECAEHGLSCIDAAYRTGLGDAHIPATVLPNYRGVRTDDAVLFTALRPDQIHRLAEALIEPELNAFERPRPLHLSAACSLIGLVGGLRDLAVSFFPEREKLRTLSEIVSQAGLTQLHVAETANEAHLAVFARGGRTETLTGSELWLAQTPMALPVKRPELAALDATARAVKAIKKQSHDLVVIDLSNAALAGHTGDMGATRKAVETVDKCLGKLAAMTEKRRGTLLVAGVYGNAELMVDEAGDPVTANTAAHTPFLLMDASGRTGGLTKRPGTLADVAPTVLDLLGVAAPAEMTGQSLLEPLDQDVRESA